MPQSIVGFLSANPIVVAVANVGAWVGAAILIWQGGRKAYKAATYIYHNSIKSWIAMERQNRNWTANCLSSDGILLLAYQAREALRLSLSFLSFGLMLGSVILLKVSLGSAASGTFERALSLSGLVLSIIFFHDAMFRSALLYRMMVKVLKLRDSAIIRQDSTIQ